MRTRSKSIDESDNGDFDETSLHRTSYRKRKQIVSDDECEESTIDMMNDDSNRTPTLVHKNPDRLDCKYLTAKERVHTLSGKLARKEQDVESLIRNKKCIGDLKKIANQHLRESKRSRVTSDSDSEEEEEESDPVEDFVEKAKEGYGGWNKLSKLEKDKAIKRLVNIERKLETDKVHVSELMKESDVDIDEIQDLMNMIEKCDDQPESSHTYRNAKSFLRRYLDDIHKKKRTKAESKELEKLRHLIYKSTPSVTRILRCSATRDEKIVLLKKFYSAASDTLNAEHAQKIQDDIDSRIKELNNHPMDVKTRGKIERKAKKLDVKSGAKVSLLYKVMNKNLPEFHKTFLMRKCRSLEMLSESDDEFYRITELIELCVQIPFVERISFAITQESSQRKKNACACRMMDELNQEMYGMSKLKEELLSFAMDHMQNFNTRNNIIALQGPPGIGKTMIAKSISKIMRVPFHEISMTGKESGDIVGHSSTWVGSKPGEIVRALTRMGIKNGVIFIDEIDKASQSCLSTLLPILDPIQRHDYRDKFIPELSLDISEVLFIITLNDLDIINSALRSRMNTFTISDYNRLDKMNIVNKFFIPDVEHTYNIGPPTVIMTEEGISHLLDKAETEEKTGVRRVKQLVHNLYRRISMLRDITLSDGSRGLLDLGIPESVRFPLKLTASVIKSLAMDDEKAQEHVSYMYT